MAAITTTMDQVLPSLIDVDVFEQAVANTNWNTIALDSSTIMRGWKESSGAQNALIDFNVVLVAGTWDIEVLYAKNANHGIISVQIDAVEKGTIDTYADPVSYNNRTTISGINVASTGKVTLRLKMTGKNASSTNYYGRIQHIQLRCTSATDTSSVKVDPDTHMPWLVDVNVFMTPIAHTNFDSNTTSSSAIYNGHHFSSSAQNDSISFDLLLGAGTWDIELMHLASLDRGIYSVQLDGVEVGTIDGYAGSAIYNQRNALTGISVAATGKKRLSLVMSTKNASSSSYRGSIHHIQLRRTA